MFRLDDATVGAIIGVLDPSFPYGVTWNTTGVSNGSHTLYAIATDVAGNSATSAGRQVNVNNAAALPTIALSFSPAPAKRANVTITAAVTTGAPSITQVQFFINGTLVSTDSTGPTYSHSWKVSAAAGKTYTVYGIVTDSLGRTAQSITYTFNP